MNKLELHTRTMEIRESAIIHPTYAVIGIYVRNGRYFSVTTREKDQWTLCGGKVDDGETDIEAFQREFIEESGLKPIKFTLFDMYYTGHENPQLCKTYLIEEMEVIDERMNGFLDNPLSKETILLDEAEGYIGWVDANDLINAGLYGEYNNSVIEMLKILNYEHI